MAATSTRDRGLRHIAALDGLRGAAVAGVLVFHGGHLKGGYLGVDLFFVLSGYLITLLLLSEWRKSRGIRLGRFWGRRARRLFPALVLLLVGVAVYSHWIAIPEERSGIRGDGFATLFYVANWHSIFSGQSYFQAGLAQSPLEHTWSLAIEEQFYLAWPLLVVGLLHLRNRPSTILRASVALAIASVALMVGLHTTGSVSDNGLYLSTATRIGAIAMGGALAAWQVLHGHTEDRSRRRGLELAGWAGIAFLAFMWSQTDLSNPMIYNGGLAACGVAVVAVIATAGHPEELSIGRALRFAPLRWLGLISYGLYLYHWPIYLWLTPERTGLSSWGLLALQAFVAIDVAVLSYVLIERPIRYGALRGPMTNVAVPAGAVVATLAILLGTVGAVPPITNSAKALTNRRAGDPTLLFVGDSVPEVLVAEGIAPQAKQLGINVANGSSVGCLPMMRAGAPHRLLDGAIEPTKFDCTDAYPRLVRDVRPDVVVMLVGSLLAFNVMIGGHGRSQCDPVYQLAERSILEQNIDVLSAHGAVVVLMTAPGVVEPSIQRRFNVRDSMQRSACSNRAIRDVAAQDVRTRFLDFASFVCPSQTTCRTSFDGLPLRPEGIHIRGDAARAVARWLVPRTLTAARQPR